MKMVMMMMKMILMMMMMSRYRMTGEDSYSWDLEIRDVRAEDEGTYQCQVLATRGAPPLR